MKTPEGTQCAILDGVVVELWENPDADFGCHPSALAGYAKDGAWELLFNGIMLNVERGPSPVEGIFKSPLSSIPPASA
jgi:hypothetical protein